MSGSPQRHRDLAQPTSAMLVEHATPSDHGMNTASSSRSLFRLFRRKSDASDSDSVFNAFDSFSLDPAAATLESPQQAHLTGRKTGKMIEAAEKYRQSIEQMSVAAAEFGTTLYECAETKGAAAGQTSLPDHFVAPDFQAAGGLHMLIANHCNLLAACIDKQLESPARQALQEYKLKVKANEDEFRVSLGAKLATLRRLEELRRGDARTRTRDLLAYRSVLLDLTSQVDDIHRLKFEFLSDMHVLGTDLAEALHSSVASTVTAEIEVFDSIARKGWSGGGLDGLLAGCPDPFIGGEHPSGNLRSDLSDTSPKLSPKLSGNASPHVMPTDGEAMSASVPSLQPRTSNLHPQASPPVAEGSNGSKSPNLFSIIPPKQFIPNEDDASVDLTLTPVQGKKEFEHSDKAHEVTEPNEEASDK